MTHFEIEQEIRVCPLTPGELEVCSQKQPGYRAGSGGANFCYKPATIDEARCIGSVDLHAVLCNFAFIIGYPERSGDGG